MPTQEHNKNSDKVNRVLKILLIVIVVVIMILVLLALSGALDNSASAPPDGPGEQPNFKFEPFIDPPEAAAI